MKCDFDYCVYNRRYTCSLGELRINMLGRCNECVMVSVPPTELKRLKKEELKGMRNLERRLGKI